MYIFLFRLQNFVLINQTNKKDGRTGKKQKPNICMCVWLREERKKSPFLKNR